MIGLVICNINTENSSTLVPSYLINEKNIEISTGVPSILKKNIINEKKCKKCNKITPEIIFIGFLVFLFSSVLILIILYCCYLIWCKWDDILD